MNNRLNNIEWENSEHKEIVDSMHELLLEFSNGIIKSWITEDYDSAKCKCGSRWLDGREWHNKGCLVSKAQQYIKNNKEN